MELEGKSALVTGGGRGIGRATALALARQGCAVAVCARTREEVEETARQVRGAGGKALAFTADVSLEADAERVVAETISQFGGLDILINNAGVFVLASVLETPVEEWDRLMAVNARGAFLFSRAALRHMRERRAGAIINISSTAGKRAYPEQSAYVASKHALLGFTKALALEAQPYGIRVHAVCPGVVATQMSAVTHADRPDRMEPEDVAQAVVYLLSLSPQAAVDELVLRRNGAVPWSS
ncbi:MAG: SDR family oxidoreductase [Armatimonadetes bacterium]|nr:SDR family oxidoreductase [Armatimonadota bacterium]